MVLFSKELKLKSGEHRPDFWAGPGDEVRPSFMELCKPHLVALCL